MVSTSLAVVADDLESANHLSNGEEAEALSEDDSAGEELGTGQIPRLLQNRSWLRGRLRRSLLGGLEEGAGVPHLLPYVLEVYLEGRGGARKAHCQ